MIKTEYKYSEITAKIIGASMEVHKILGNGFQEVIYQRALDKEMSLQGLCFSREHEMPIFYKEEQIGTRRVDFLVEGVISVELKNLSNNVNTILSEIKQDIKLLDKHETDILSLQHTQKAQQESITALSNSIDKLTATVSNVSTQFAELSMKFLTSAAWVAGGAAVILVLWSLISSGMLKISGA
jgi:GxxExxY protein